MAAVELAPSTAEPPEQHAAISVMTAAEPMEQHVDAPTTAQSLLAGLAGRFDFWSARRTQIRPPAVEQVAVLAPPIDAPLAATGTFGWFSVILQSTFRR